MSLCLECEGREYTKVARHLHPIGDDLVKLVRLAKD